MSAPIQYAIRHSNRFVYSAAISESIMEARMQPQSDGRQRCLRFELTTQPRAKVFAYQDPLGNVVHHFDIPARHSRLWVTANAVVEMQPGVTLPETLPERTWDDLNRIVAGGQRWHNLQPSRFARQTPLLGEFADEIDWRRDADPLTLMRRLNAALVRTLKYAASHTRVDSPIDDALRARAGVCQDLAHIMIALTRKIGIPCRYVSGYLSPSAENRDRSAQGATHAWAEAWLPTLGWVGFDPANDVLAGERHVRVGVGRDYADVPPTRGVFRGEASSELSVLVTVAHADTPIKPEQMMPMTTWVSPEVAEPEPFDYAQQQQQQ